MENPIERLRNKLSPFLNLTKMLSEAENELTPFKNEKLNDLVRIDLEVCKQNLPQIHDHLAHAEEFINDPNEKTRYKVNNILTNLPKTVDAELQLKDYAVNNFVQQLSRVKNDNYLPIIDEMFLYYTKLLKHQEEELSNYRKVCGD